MQSALHQESCLPQEDQVVPCTLEFQNCYALPRTEIGKIGLTEIETNLVNEVPYDLTHGKEGEPSHLLLGNAQEVQDDMRWQCAASQPQVDSVWERWHEMSNDEPKQFYAAMRRAGEAWRLLLQVDTDPRIGLEWQAWGRGYFWIREDDLAARHFDHVCLVTQHT